MLQSTLVDSLTNKYLDEVPEQYRINQQMRDGPNYHITVIGPIEYTTDMSKDTNQDTNQDQNIQICDLGLGRLVEGENETYYVLVSCPEADTIRKRYNLPSIHYHITLGFRFSDIHKEKGLNTLVKLPSTHDITKHLLTSYNDITTNPKFLQLAEWTMSISQSLNLETSENYVRELIPDLKALMMKMAQVYNTNQAYEKLLQLADELIGCEDIDGYFIAIKVRNHIGMDLTAILSQNKLLEVKIPVNYDKKRLDLILKALNSQKFRKNPVYYELSRKATDHSLREPNGTTIVKLDLPYNFGWVIPGQLAGSSCPNEADIEVFARMGIKHVITCLENPLQIKPINGLDIHFCEVQDQRPPTGEQLNDMLRIVSKAHTEPVVVHCQGGRGRTNLVLVCDLLRKDPTLGSHEAIKQITALRPNLVFHSSQLEFIKDFSNRIHTVILEPNTETPNPDIETKIGSEIVRSKIKLPKIILFVGYQASGKSTLSQHMCKCLGDKVIRINKDDMRHDSVDIFLDNIKNTKTILVDCCNFDKVTRKEWLDLAFNPSAWAIFMDTPFEECKYRITRRKGHPTIMDGPGGARILDSVRDKLDPPVLEEGFKRIFRIQKDSELDLFLSDLGLPPIPVEDDTHGNIIKFPRTRHLFNLGSASRDDLLLSPAEQHKFLQHVLEVHEKVDGANMGFSVDDSYKILAQNRSHYVNSGDHPQFKLIDKWIAKHQNELLSVLEHETEILYGEWLYMKHSIHYTHLPDYFLAFDLYNRRTRRFLSRAELEKRLSGTTIYLVPLITTKKFESLDEIRALVKTKSQFYDGPIEGVYLRVPNDEGFTIDRAKVVRSDFLCGNTEGGDVRHWTKVQLVINSLRE